MHNQSRLLEWRQRWNGSLFQFLRRRVRSSVDVQDLAQETYLRLLRADLDEVRNPLGYLQQVASHVAMEWCDRQPRSDSMVVFDEDMLVDGQLPELELDARLSQRRLEETLASISPMMRAVVLLRLRDERSYQEIAAELRITDRQVRRYLERGYEFHAPHRCEVLTAYIEPIGAELHTRLERKALGTYRHLEFRCW